MGDGRKKVWDGVAIAWLKCYLVQDPYDSTATLSFAPEKNDFRFNVKIYIWKKVLFLPYTTVHIPYFKRA